MKIFRLCSTLFTVQPLPVSELCHLHSPPQILRENKMKKLIILKNLVHIYALSFLMFVTSLTSNFSKKLPWNPYSFSSVQFWFSAYMIVLYSRCAQLRWNFLVLLFRMEVLGLVLGMKLLDSGHEIEVCQHVLFRIPCVWRATQPQKLHDTSSQMITEYFLF